VKMILFTFIVLLLSATPCFTEEKKTNSSGTGTKPVTEAPVPVTPQPIEPFKPSQEISADSVISLPTDI